MLAEKRLPHLLLRGNGQAGAREVNLRAHLIGDELKHVNRFHVLLRLVVSEIDELDHPDTDVFSHRLKFSLDISLLRCVILHNRAEEEPERGEVQILTRNADRLLILL